MDFTRTDEEQTFRKELADLLKAPTITRSGSTEQETYDLPFNEREPT